MRPEGPIRLIPVVPLRPAELSAIAAPKGEEGVRARETIAAQLGRLPRGRAFRLDRKPLPDFADTPFDP